MTPEMTQFLTQLAAGICLGWIILRKDRRIAYLRAAAGDRDMWARRCATCGRRIRDRPCLVVTEPRGSGLHERVFHTGAPRHCDLAAHTTTEQDPRP